MRKGREIIGLPVVNLATGKELGAVEDLIWNLQMGKVSSLIVRTTGVLGSQCYVPYPEVSNIGTDAITVASEVIENEVEHAESERRVSQLAGLPVLTVNGNNVGTIEDLIFSLTDGEVLGYEVSTGLVGDLISGRNQVSPERVVTWGEEAVIVNETGYDDCENKEEL